ncbi:hypothetical protein [Nonomuraea typhae]|uniref:Uncharacterized protein n=1 Tax=Nonomuraea typhae TaxID=2603600 RepID=A0ABW7YQS6_9ACTN
MRSQLLAFKLSKPIETHPSGGTWNGEAKAVAGWYCTKNSCCWNHCEVGYYGGTSLECREMAYGLGRLKCDRN